MLYPLAVSSLRSWGRGGLASRLRPNPGDGGGGGRDGAGCWALVPAASMPPWHMHWHARLQDSGGALGPAHDRGPCPSRAQVRRSSTAWTCPVLASHLDRLRQPGGACWRGSVSGRGVERGMERLGVLPRLFI